MKQKNFIKSLTYALRGLGFFYRSEIHALYHGLAAALVIAAGFIFNISRLDWMIVIIAIALVIISEMINTAIESLLDFIHPEKHPHVGNIKDLTAGIVLFSALIAVALGIFVFYPEIVALL